jgi:hypothetical protein
MAVLHRDGFRCLLCGKRGLDANPLQVHHVIPRSKGTPDSRWALASLHAWGCHPRMAANGWKVWRDYLLERIAVNEQKAAARRLA